MLITTQTDTAVHAWHEWLHNCEDTDAHVLRPDDARREYDLPESYFDNRGGVFDSRDHLIDFNALNTCLWDYFEAHPDCELVPDCEVYGISSVDSPHSTTTRLTRLETRQGTVDTGKTIVII